MKGLALGLIGALCLCSATTDARAQPSARISLDATFGPGSARTDGSYRRLSRQATVDAMLAMRVRELTHGAVFAAINAAAHSEWGGSDIGCGPIPVDGCGTNFPGFEWLGATLGWQDRQAIFRASTGAAYVQADWEGWSVAWQSRVDLSIPTRWHLAPVLSLRAIVVPNYPNGDRFQLFALGFGLRVK